MSPATDGLTLVKLGGSLLTDKRGHEHARTDTIRRLARELAEASSEAPGTLILGHGSGSFGHAEASRRGLSGRAPSAAGPQAIAGVHAAAARLHGLVLEELRSAGVHPLSFPPSASLVSKGDGLGDWYAEPLLAALDAGVLPVVYGDVVLGARGLARVCSTEDALAAVWRSLRAAGRRILVCLWLGETDGVLDADGVSLPEIREETPELARALGPAAGADVTGGMAHRIATALRLAAAGVPSWIGDGRAPGALAAALRGRPAGGTWVLPPRSPNG